MKIFARISNTHNFTWYWLKFSEWNYVCYDRSIISSWKYLRAGLNNHTSFWLLFFFFTMVCAIFSLLRRIFDSCHSRVILSIFSLCLQVFYLVSFVSTKRMHRGTYIFEVFSCMYTKLYCDLRWWRFLSVYFQFVRASVSCANVN